MLLARRGNRAGAEAAFRRADARGHAGAACSLGVILVRANDPDGAEAAFQRAHERGHPGGTYNLGLLLAAGGNDAAAAEFLGRAAASPDGRVARLAAAALDAAHH